MRFPTFFNPFENRKKKKKKPQSPLGSCKVLQISHGSRRGLIPPSQQPEEPRITDAGGSAWLGALGARGSPSSAEGQPWSGAPLSPFGPRGLPGQHDPSFLCHHSASSATTEASTISVMLWQWRGRAGAPPPTPAASRSSGRAVGWEGRGWDVLPGFCHRGEVVLLSRPF